MGFIIDSDCRLKSDSDTIEDLNSIEENNEKCLLCGKKYIDKDLRHIVEMKSMYYPDSDFLMENHKSGAYAKFNICHVCFVENIDIIINSHKNLKKL